MTTKSDLYLLDMTAFSDKQERDNVDEVDNCLADDVLPLLSETS